LITQGSRLHRSSRLYNHRAQGCEGELAVAAVSCGEQLVSQSSSCGEQLVSQSSSCGEQLVSQSSSCGEQLVSQSLTCKKRHFYFAGLTPAKAKSSSLGLQADNKTMPSWRMRIQVLIFQTGHAVSFYAFSPPPDYSCQVCKSLGKSHVLCCSHSIFAFLLSMPLTQQPLKHAFRVCGQSHEALHPEPWMKEIQAGRPLGSVSSKLSFALILFTVYHLHHAVE
jgi:hypothetical protein